MEMKCYFWAPHNEGRQKGLACSETHIKMRRRLEHSTIQVLLNDGLFVDGAWSGVVACEEVRRGHGRNSSHLTLGLAMEASALARTLPESIPGLWNLAQCVGGVRADWLSVGSSWSLRIWVTGRSIR